MASIRKRGDSYQARVSKQGFPQEVKTFSTRNEAARWARTVESAMEAGQHACNRVAQSMTFGELLARYRTAVTPTKRGAADEQIRLKALERRRMCKLAVANVSPQVIADFRDERLKECCASTVIRDMAVLSSIFNHARREWNIGVSNPVLLVRKPQSPAGRDRMLTTDEEAALVRASTPEGRRNSLLAPLLIVALETAMRRGELLGLRWCDVDLERAVVRLGMTKNGSSRRVPLSSRAVAAFASISRASDKPFPISTAALDKMFGRLCRRANIVDFRFHDLRHTATTKLAEKLPNVIELAAVTGHRSLQMLKRYYHPTAESLALKLG